MLVGPTGPEPGIWPYGVDAFLRPVRDACAIVAVRLRLYFLNAELEANEIYAVSTKDTDSDSLSQ
jgi:hypothetical protein